jgi:hypothetical protein
MSDTTAHTSDPSIQPSKRPPERNLHLGRLTSDSVALYIGDVPEPVILNVAREAILGRYSPNNPIQPALDLTRYDAYKRGVSRLHATLYRTDTNDFMVSDRASGNGTYLNGRRLEPFKAARLASGDRIRLAQLELEIYFGPEEIAAGSEAQAPSTSSAAEVPPTPAEPASPPDTVPVGALKPPVTEAPKSAPTHFQGAVKLDPQHVFSQMGLLDERVLQQLTAMKDANVGLVLKIEAQTASGFDAATIRWLAALCEELKFSNATFDNEKQG